MNISTHFNEPNIILNMTTFFFLNRQKSFPGLEIEILQETTTHSIKKKSTH